MQLEITMIKVAWWDVVSCDVADFSWEFTPYYRDWLPVYVEVTAGAFLPGTRTRILACICRSLGEPGTGSLSS
jgi:hypothetical protein